MTEIPKDDLSHEATSQAKLPETKSSFSMESQSSLASEVQKKRRGLQRVVENISPILERTKLDFDACRDVVGKLIVDKETSINERLKTTVPQAAAPEKPRQPIECWRKATPCPGIWEKMSGNDQYRLCEMCGHFVYDFSGMDLPEAQQLVFKREGNTNPTFYRRPDGRFLTSNCPVGLKRGQSMLLIAGAGLTVGLLALVLLVSRPASTASAQPQDLPKQDQAVKASGQSSAADKKIRTSTEMNGRLNQTSSTNSPLPVQSSTPIPAQQRTSSGFSWSDYVREVESAQKARQEAEQQSLQAGSGAVPQVAPQAASGSAPNQQSTVVSGVSIQSPAAAPTAAPATNLILQPQTVPAAGNESGHSAPADEQPAPQSDSSSSNNNNGVKYYGK